MNISLTGAHRASHPSIGWVLSIILLGVNSLLAQSAGVDPERPPERGKAYRLLDNVYWVGSADHGSLLLTTPAGHILVDTTAEETAPWVREKIESLGFRPQDIKLILSTHAHADHVGGFMYFKKLTGATVITAAADAPVMSDGGRSDFRSDGRQLFTPIVPDRTVVDGDEVKLGNLTLVAHITPGHTRGCTTWTTLLEHGGRKYQTVIACQPDVHGDRAPLLNNPRYPNMADDFAKAFAVLKSLPCDVFLALRSESFGLQAKVKRLEQNAEPSPFIDPRGYRAFVAEYERRYLDQLAKERSASR
jgi:metallo-beta-lactamase class B